MTISNDELLSLNSLVTESPGLEDPVLLGNIVQELQSIAPGVAGGGGVLWEPGGTTSGLVYADFDEALAALVATGLPGVFMCSDRFAPTSFPPVPHTFIRNSRIVGARLDGGTTITFPEGCELIGPRWFECADFICTSTATPVISDWPTAGPDFDNRIVFRGPNPGSAGLGIGSVPFISLLPAPGFVLVDQAFTVLAITSPVFGMPIAGASLTLQVQDQGAIHDGHTSGVAGTSIKPRRIGAGARIDDDNPLFMGTTDYVAAGGSAEPRYAARKGVLELPPVTGAGTVSPLVGQVVVIATTTAVTVRLPSIDSPNILGTKAAGRSIWIKDLSGTPAVTIVPADAADNINLAAASVADPSALAAGEGREYTASAGGGPGGTWMSF